MKNKETTQKIELIYLINPVKPHWNTKVPFVEKYIKQLLIDPSSSLAQNPDQQYSILRYSRRSESELIEIVELYSQLGIKHTKEIVVLKLSRLIFYEIIANIATELKIRDENDLYEKVNMVYNELYSNQNLEELESSITEEQEAITNQKVESAFSTVNKGGNLNKAKEHKNLAKNIIDLINQEQKTDECKKSSILVAKKIIFDVIYNELLKKEIEKKITPIIKSYIEKYIKDYQSFEALSMHPLDTRQTYMLIGAPANGKSTLLNVIEREIYKKNKVGFFDVVKINTDNHRNLVINKQGRATMTIHDAKLSHDESNLITQEIFNKLKNKIRDAKAPNILIECAHYSNHKIDLALMGGGQLHFYCITIPPELALKRSIIRGEKDGRYIDTHYLLQSQKDISDNKKFADLMMSDNNINYKLYNNEAHEKDPLLIMEADVKNKKITIYDIEKVDKFFKHEKINLDAISTEELYSTASDDESMKTLSINQLWKNLLGKTFFKKLKNKGISLNFKDRERAESLDTKDDIDAYEKLIKERETEESLDANIDDYCERLIKKRSREVFQDTKDDIEDHEKLSKKRKIGESQDTEEHKESNIELDFNIEGVGGLGFIGNEFPAPNYSLTKLNIFFTGIPIPPTQLSISFPELKNTYINKGDVNYFVGYIAAQALIPGIICVTDIVNGHNKEGTCYGYYKNNFDLYGKFATTVFSMLIFKFSSYQGVNLVNSMIVSKIATDTAISIIEGDFSIDPKLYANEMLRYLTKMGATNLLSFYFNANDDVPTAILLNITPSLMDLVASVVYQGAVMLDEILNPNGEHIDFDYYL